MPSDQAVGSGTSPSVHPRHAVFARAAIFAGAGFALGWALHWLFLPSQSGAWLGLYSTGKFAALALATVIGAALAWLGSRFPRTNGSEFVAVIVTASLALLLGQFSQGINLVDGVDLAVNLLAADGFLHGLKHFQHTALTYDWTSSGPDFHEEFITWYPPGPTWLFVAVSRLTGLAPLNAARLLWPLVYLLNVALLARVLRLFAANSTWLDRPVKRLLLAAAALWWIVACNPAVLITADLLALPFNLLVLLACFHLIQGDRSLWRWALAGLAGGLIYLFKYSQFIDAAALLAVTAAWSFLREPQPRRLPPILLAFILLLAVPLTLTKSQGRDSAFQYSEKATLAHSNYILDNYGPRYETTGTPLFAALGVAGGLGWNSLGYGEWPSVVTFLAQRSPVNAVWDRLGWNRVCSWCLVFGLVLTPLAWRLLRVRPSLPGPGPAWLLLTASALAVAMLAVVGFQKGYQWNIGLEGLGRLLLPMSAVVVVLLVTAVERRFAFALFVAVVYVFGPAATDIDQTLGVRWNPPATPVPAHTLAPDPADFARWTALAQSRHARALLILVDDLTPHQRVFARNGRIATFGATIPICFIEPSQLASLLQNPAPAPQLALLASASTLAPTLRQQVASHDFILIQP